MTIRDDDLIFNNQNFGENRRNDLQNQFIQLSKSYQLMFNNDSYKYNIPTEISSIAILGHGLGEQDYNYFRTLCGDFSTVSFTIYWYKYHTGININTMVDKLRIKINL